MSKVNMPVNACKAGDVIAEDVYNDKGVTLIAKNTIINPYIKEKLLRMDVSYVWLYQPEDRPFDKQEQDDYKAFQKDYKKVVLFVKQCINKLSVGGTVNYQEIKSISEVIFGKVNDSRHIIRCLTEIRSADEYTYTHSVNVAFYSMLTAKWMCMGEDEIRALIQAGLLHDIGKVKIPDNVLNKKGKLTPEEYEIIKRHTVYGYALVNNIPEFDQKIKNAILLHHERNDGSGYPKGISGETIELYARIVSIADVYDAMTQNRVYKRKTTPFDAFQMFMTTGIATFDPTILKVFIHNLSVYLIGTSVALNNGETGEIVYVPPQAIVYPIIQVNSDYVDLSKERDLKLIDIIER